MSDRHVHAPGDGSVIGARRHSIDVRVIGLNSHRQSPWLVTVSIQEGIPSEKRHGKRKSDIWMRAPAR